MSNKEQIIDTIQSVFLSADSRDWARCKSYFASEVFVDYSSLTGIPGKTISRDELITNWEGFLPKFKSTQHMLTNFEVTLQNEKADATFYGHAIHHLPHSKGGDLWSVFGAYTVALIHTSEGWKITFFALHLTAQDGNRMLPAIAANLPEEEPVSFVSEGERIAGKLLLPRGFKKEGNLPVFLVFGAWTQVKEQIQYVYGRKLAERGFAVLNFDFRYWGASAGQPRHYESTAAKVKDVMNAIDFVKTLPYLDATRINLIGVCAGAGIALRVAAQSSDVRHVATVARWLQHPATTPFFYGGAEGVNARLRLADEAEKKYAATGIMEEVDAYNPQDSHAAMFFPVDYYANPERGAIPEWENRFAVTGWKEWLTMNSIDHLAEKISIPLIMVHSDGAALPDNVRQFYNKVPAAQKKLVWLEGEHTQFYDHDAQIDQALEAILKFDELSQA